jgi:hypothetical protein
MSYTIRKASRAEAKPLIGIYAQSNAGKTFSALLLARGFVGAAGRILMIETEGGRGEAYGDPAEYPEIGGYDVIPMRSNFSPRSFGEAITTAEEAKPDALLIDSASLEWAGTGGVLDMAAKASEGGAKGVLVWQRPKIDHQTHFMQRVLSTPIPLVILCLRAKYPMEQRPDRNGKMEWARSTVLEPQQSDDILFELFAHGWIGQDHLFHPTKMTNRSLAEVFPEGQAISVDTGKHLSAWAAMRKPAETAKPQAEPPIGEWGGHAGPEQWGDAATMRIAKAATIEALDGLVGKLAPRFEQYRAWSAKKADDLQNLIDVSRKELSEAPAQ